MVSADDPRVKGCAFAKLQGQSNFPEPGYYLVKKYEVLLGRKSKSSSLDVVLGDNMNISRKHAKLEYNFSEGAYQLVVMGKNGVTVGGVLYTPTSPPLSLKSRDEIQIGDTTFHFLLPKQEFPEPLATKSSKKRPKLPNREPGPSPAKKATLAVKIKSPKKPTPKKSPDAAKDPPGHSQGHRHDHHHHHDRRHVDAAGPSGSKHREVERYRAEDRHRKPDYYEEAQEAEEEYGQDRAAQYHDGGYGGGHDYGEQQQYGSGYPSRGREQEEEDEEEEMDVDDNDEDNGDDDAGAEEYDDAGGEEYDDAGAEEYDDGGDDNESDGQGDGGDGYDDYSD